MPNANKKPDHQLTCLLMQAENPSIDYKDQCQEDQNKPDNPHIAPAWNAFMVRDIISGMFTEEAYMNEDWESDRDEDADDTKITDAEMEETAPGTIQQVTETVLGHIPSDKMYEAMYAEIRDLAQTVVTYMTPEHREALLGAARKKVQGAKAKNESE